MNAQQNGGETLGDPKANDTGRRRLFKALLDAVVIVCSILLAFSLDAWWDSRKERVASQQLLRDLLAEFEQVQSQLRRAVARNEMVIAAADSLISGVASSSTPQSVPASHVGSLLVTPTTDPRQGNLDALVMAGDFRLIPSARLRNLLADWPAALQDVREEELAAWTFVYEELIPHLAQVANLSHALNWRLIEEQSDYRGGLGQGTVLQPNAERLVLTPDRTLANLLELRRYLAALVIDNHRELQLHIEQIIGELTVLTR